MNNTAAESAGKPVTLDTEEHVKSSRFSHTKGHTNKPYKYGTVLGKINNMGTFAEADDDENN